MLEPRPTNTGAENRASEDSQRALRRTISRSRSPRRGTGDEQSFLAHQPQIARHPEPSLTDVREVALQEDNFEAVNVNRTVKS